MIHETRSEVPRASKRIRVPVADPGDFVANTRRSLPPSNRLPRSAAADLLAPRAVWGTARLPGDGPRAARGLVGRPGRTRGRSGCCSRWSLSGGGSERWKAGYARTGEDVAATRRVQAALTEFCRARPCCAADLPYFCPTVAPSSPNSKSGQHIESFQMVAGLPDCPTTFGPVRPKSASGLSAPFGLWARAVRRRILSSIPGKTVGQWGSQ